MRRSVITAALLLAATWLSCSPALPQAPPPVPALPDTERRSVYSVTASLCNCAIGFALYGDATDFGAWIEVWVDGVFIPPAAYNVTSPTGPLATIPRPITSAILTFVEPQTGIVQIIGARRPRRPNQFQENQPVTARMLNQVITDIVAMERERWDRQGRYVQVPPGETAPVLPPAADRANTYACFDASGNLLPCTTAPGVLPPPPTPPSLYDFLISGFGAF